MHSETLFAEHWFINNCISLLFRCKPPVVWSASPQIKTYNSKLWIFTISQHQLLHQSYFSDVLLHTIHDTFLVIFYNMPPRSILCHCARGSCFQTWIFYCCFWPPKNSIAVWKYSWRLTVKRYVYVWSNLFWIGSYSNHMFLISDTCIGF